jgi:serine/threonine protein kinase
VEQGRLPAARWRPVARRAFEALARLHELSRAGESLGAVHGDISPDNVLVAGPPHDGVAFVDFGAASARGLGDATGRGTLPFADPEVVRGERAPDAAADVWALAATLVSAAGVRLVDAEDEPARLLEVAERGVRIERLRDVRGLASAAELRAMESALELDRARRTTSAREMARAFGAPW